MKQPNFLLYSATGQAPDPATRPATPGRPQRLQEPMLLNFYGRQFVGVLTLVSIVVLGMLSLKGLSVTLSKQRWAQQ
jgi:hypothetical protein